MPWTTFTDPEVARVGLTEAEARQEHGEKLQVLCLPLTKVDRAITKGETEGIIKILVAPGGIVPSFASRFTGGEIVGAHITGPDAGELLHEIIVVMKSRLPSGLLASPMHVYPTLSFGIRQTVGELCGTAAGE
ncbi:MAG: hypothetical protein ACR2PL_09970 [Dehalococcoidia bacterium]